MIATPSGTSQVSVRPCWARSSTINTSCHPRAAHLHDVMVQQSRGLALPDEGDEGIGNDVHEVADYPSRRNQQEQTVPPGHPPSRE